MSSFEEHLDLFDDTKGMIKDFSSDQIREFIKQEKSKQRVFSSAFKSLEHQESIDFWTEKNLELHE